MNADVQRWLGRLSDAWAEVTLALAELEHDEAVAELRESSWNEDIQKVLLADSDEIRRELREDEAAEAGPDEPGSEGGAPRD